MKTRDTLMRLYSVSETKAKYVYQILFILLIGALNALSSISVGLLSQGVLEYTSGDLYVGFGVFLFATLVAALLDWVRSNQLIGLVEAAKVTYRRHTADSLLGADYASAQKFQAGDLISRVNSDIESAGSVSELVITGVRNVAIPALLVVVMAVLDWRLALGYIGPLLLIFLYNRLMSERSGEGIGPWRVAFAAMTAETLDLISNRTTIKAFRLGRKADEWAEEKIEAFRKKGVRGLARLYVGTIPGLFVNTLPLFGCAFVGAVLLYRGQVSLQAFVSALLMAQVATGELLNLPNVTVNLPEKIVAGNRLFELWDLEQEDFGEADTGCGDAAIQFRDVSFSYRTDEEGDRPVLRHISFSVRPGEKVALVGPSGCGKSTILKLITGLYTPDSGTISLWGRELADWDIQSARSKMNMMQQETFIFEGTVRENILCALPGATAAQLEAAAERAHILDWIREQPLGWDAPVGERGSQLSGGLRQRVGLARIFLHDAPLLLLDEATAALDTENEAGVLRALKAAGEGVTEIHVAHRLAAIVDADRILVLGDGRIVEEGDHASLMEAGGVYAGLYNEQERESHGEE